MRPSRFEIMSLVRQSDNVVLRPVGPSAEGGRTRVKGRMADALAAPIAYGVRRNGAPTLANMRENGVRAVTATCEGCRCEADVNVDALPETLAVPKVGRWLRCSRCGGKTISTRSAWHTAQPAGVPDYR
jgi:hypothetical protein